jgi:hypothetical protein
MHEVVAEVQSLHATRRRLSGTGALPLDGVERRDEVGDGARPDHEVDVELPRDRLPLVELREAAHQPDGEVAAAPALLAQVAEQRHHLLDRLPANGARVEEDQFGVLRRVDDLVPARHQLRVDRERVVLVHLATVRDDVRPHRTAAGACGERSFTSAILAASPPAARAGGTAHARDDERLSRGSAPPPTRPRAPRW